METPLFLSKPAPKNPLQTNFEEKTSGNFLSSAFFFVLNIFLYLERNLSSKIMAVIYMMFSNLFYIMIALLAKMSSNLPPNQIIYNRAFYEVFFSYLTIISMNGLIYTRNKETNRLLLVRGFAGGLGFGMYFHALFYLPISIWVVLFMLSPLWVGLWTAIKEHKFDGWTFLCMISSFIGMMMIIKPGFGDGEEKYRADLWGFYYGVFLSIFVSMLTGFVFFSIQNLKGKTHLATIVFYYNVFNLIFAGFGQIFEGAKPLTWFNHGIVFSIGVFGWLGQMIRSRALQIEKVTILFQIIF